MITYVQFQFKKCFSLGSIVHEFWEEQFIHFPTGHSIGKRPPKDHSHHIKYETNM